MVKSLISFLIFHLKKEQKKVIIVNYYSYKNRLVYTKNKETEYKIQVKIRYDVYSETPLVRLPLPKMWPFKRDGLLSGIEINTLMFRFNFFSGFSEGVASCQGGLCFRNLIQIRWIEIDILSKTVS